MDFVLRTDNSFLQMDKILVFGREFHGLESHCQSTSPLSSPLLLTVPIEKNDIYCYFVNKTKVKDERSIWSNRIPLISLKVALFRTLSVPDSFSKGWE